MAWSIAKADATEVETYLVPGRLVSVLPLLEDNVTGGPLIPVDPNPPCPRALPSTEDCSRVLMCIQYVRGKLRVIEFLDFQDFGNLATLED